MQAIMGSGDTLEDLHQPDTNGKSALLKLMYITNTPEIATIAQKTGVDRIFVDLEKIGKYERQRNFDSVKSNHTIDDIAEIRPLLDNSELLVRSNPLYEKSKEEIDTIIERGADIVMLPMWETPEDVKRFVDIVNGRAKTMLLLETKEADANLDSVLTQAGIDEIHIGLNDLHISYQKRFMFELLADGTVERLCTSLKKTKLPYGFGGISGIGRGLLPAEYILGEHYRLGSSMVILSRTFCDIASSDLDKIEEIFTLGINRIREYEKTLQYSAASFLKKNQQMVRQRVQAILEDLA